MRLKNQSTTRSRASASQFSQRDFKDMETIPMMNQSFDKDSEMVDQLKLAKMPDSDPSKNAAQGSSASAAAAAGASTSAAA